MSVHKYARHAEKFGDQRVVYEAAFEEGLLSVDEMLALGRRLLKTDPGGKRRDKPAWRRR